MFEQQKPFGETLAGLMRAKKLSAKRLAGLAGYKSKTSIVRILREESVHSGRERLFARMDELGLLTPDERQALLRGLEFSRVGGDRAMARLGLRRLLTGEWNARAPAPALANALESLRAAHSARILLLNGCHPEVVLPLRDILRKRPAHAMEHFVTVGASARQDMDALCAILSIAFVPAYACALQDTQAPDGLSTRQDALCFTAQDRDGVGTDTLILFPGGEDAVIHTQPAAHGLFQFIRQAIARDNFRPVVSAGAQRDGPEAIVEAVRFCTELERGRNARVVKPDICLNEINGALLRPALLDGGALRQFPNWDERQLRARFEEFFYYHDQRFQDNACGTHAHWQVISPRAMRHFALTGRFDSHFSTIRPFTVEERIAILEGAMQRMRANRGTCMHFWNVGGSLAMEVHCLENMGVIAFPAGQEGGLDISFQATILRDQRLSALFQECFDDDLLRNCTMSAQESMRYMAGLLDELRAAP